MKDRSSGKDYNPLWDISIPCDRRLAVRALVASISSLKMLHWDSGAVWHSRHMGTRT